MKLYMFSLVAILFVAACTSKNKPQLEGVNMVPWCIVGFDAKERTPKERIVMLEEFGFTKYGFDWKDRSFDLIEEEFRLAEQHQINITSLLLWMHPKRDSIGKLSADNESMVTFLSARNQKPVVWLSFSHLFFDHLNHDESLDLATRFVSYVKSRTDSVGCQLALYNHHGWFGNPHNQLDIIDALPDDSIRMVLNFHHIHPYLNDYESIIKKAVPYLDCVNVSGLRKDGPQILTLGEGDCEAKLISLLVKEGYAGVWGVLGHRKDEDVKVVLRDNLNGWEALVREYRSN